MVRLTALTLGALCASLTTAAHAQDVDQATILANLGEAYSAANLENGARVFRRCQSCHTLGEGGPNMVGPNLFGVLQHAPASKEDYPYSNALKNADIEWSAETMDQWITNPRGFIQGNRMSFAGLRDADQRRDVIAYLAVETYDASASE